MLKKIIKYFFLTKDDRFFVNYSARELANEDILNNVRKGRMLIDCSHVLYPKWQIKNWLIVKSRPGYEVHALYPSKVLVWSTWKVWALGIAKFLYNKDFALMRAMGAEKTLKVSAGDFSSWVECFGRARRVVNGLTRKQDVLDLKVEGVLIGDLVYDTYLKRNKVPTVDVDDPNLVRVIAMTYYCVKKIKILLSKGRYDEVYLTHGVYVFFGLMARIALSEGVRVFVVQNSRGLFAQRLTLDHPFQTPRFEGYRDMVQCLSPFELEKRRAEARHRLEDRLSGKIDASIAYMRKSAYEKNERSESEVIIEFFPMRPTVLILLHCFFDSPHIYKWMLYEDFYEWVRDSLSFLEKNRVNVIVKEHPNGIDGNDKVVGQLKLDFKKAFFVSKHANTKMIIQECKPIFALTVYGTMAHELAYLGLPVINAGDNPHSSFGFSKTPSTREEYRRVMGDVIEGGAWEIEREEIEDFYFSHYLAKKPGFAPVFNEVVEASFDLNSKYQEILSRMPAKILTEMVQEASASIKETDVYENVV